MSKELKVGDRGWKKIDGFDYSISSDGEVRSDKTGRILKGGISSGYRTVSLIGYVDGKRDQWAAKIHHLVMYSFVGPRPAGMVINHKNGVKLDNQLENLEYCTPRENRDHAKAHRLYRSGSKCSWSKLSEEAVTTIRRAYDVGLSQRHLARAFMVDRKAIQQILNRKAWKYV